MISIEQKLRRKVDKIKDNDFIQEYIDLNHMSEVDYGSVLGSVKLPHHYVKKRESATTKLQVVFDASSKTSTGHSLNEALMVGTKLQDDIIPLMI